MSLKSDSFDPNEILNQLHDELRYAVGVPVMRMAGPELEEFISVNVREALLRAFSQAEALYINEAFKQSEQSSRNMLEAVLAGGELRRREEEKG